MDELMISTAQMNGLMVITVRGELDIIGKPLLCTRIDDALRTGDGPLVIDLSGVSFIDAQGLSALMVSRRHATELNRSLTLAGVSAAVRRLLQLTNLEDSFVMMASPDTVSPPDARDLLARMQ
ncbi:anti-anti-sigma factor [Streptosporangium subroseum]|uniref:Anti-sigma factor antagonist n=1 Tax=Streptosporangium subroseum TaxID=106412 RepID=A0A239PBP7_9ACTN|nr:STAS domain-containing protein [Streptosporangium subroseum]SNT63829.1 anti-anti-sigma factor [Streptosporangium subroseum]